MEKFELFNIAIGKIIDVVTVETVWQLNMRVTLCIPQVYVQEN